MLCCHTRLNFDETDTPLPFYILLHPLEWWRSTDSYSEFRLRQVQRPLCPSCQTQLSLGEEMVQWVGNFTAPSTRTNSSTGNMERMIKHLFSIHEFILRMHHYISISRLIPIFISSRSISLGSPTFMFLELQCWITWLLREKCKLLSNSALHFDMALANSWFACVTALTNTSVNRRFLCAGISGDGQSLASGISHYGPHSKWPSWFLHPAKCQLLRCCNFKSQNVTKFADKSSFQHGKRTPYILNNSIQTSR